MRSTLALAAAALAAPALSAVLPPSPDYVTVSELMKEKRADSSAHLLFAHFMIGIVADRTSASDYDADIARAKLIGIDAFALNIGVDSYTDQQLGYAYQSAANNNFSVFISFDFNWWNSSSQATAIGQKVAQYASLPAQLLISGKPLVSSFAGDGLDVSAMRSAVGEDIFFAPNFHPENDDFDEVDGALSWMAWPENGKNKAPDGWGNISVIEAQTEYTDALGDKAFIAPLSAHFFTHFGPEEPAYPKNFIFPSDLLWYYRWEEILATSPQYVELVTWNDYGESHYIAPLSSPHNDDGSSKWANDMPHDAFLQMAIPYGKAFKAGASAVDDYITDDYIVYWYRQNPGDIDCDSTDTTMGAASNSSGNYFHGKPYGWEQLADNIFAVTLLTSPATLQIQSNQTVYTVDMPAGARAVQVPFNLGAQTFSLIRNGNVVMSNTSLKSITTDCVCGIYNYNFYTGSVPAQDYETLQPAGLQLFTNGLNVACDATPSLPATPPATQAPTSTVSVAMAPTGLQMR